ncbi:hypothetical protein E4L95_05340 [Paracoccus liaowanqingii]|uniref:Helicase/UvrB N-terminal domain-containing protein n=1 Tax=Paracoccus liaowanqingii TaxID=2560053 RepID=A0A4Z1CQJ2_9RHOB|nr:hypothetical protein [Paracoccus liaowanqingii]TGN67329.1 hypothetical protein E4L95_05340 [Paracoccus liaowanqingii]
MLDTTNATPANALAAFNIDVANLPMHSIDAIQRTPADTVIVDYPCGFGKSTRMIAGLRDNPDQQVLIVVPDLEQVRQLIADAHRHGVKLYQPLSDAAAREDKATGSPFDFLHETKRDALQALIQAGHNVITTHKLYSEIAVLARSGMLQNVEVHIDEVLSVSEEATGITQCSRNRQDANDWRCLYIDKGYATICQDTGRIVPTEDWRQQRDGLAGNLPTAFFDAAEAGRLYTDIPGMGQHIIMGELPVVILKLAKRVKIYTYRFSGSYMAAYLQRHGVQYSFARYSDISPEEADRQFRAKARELVTIDPVARLDGVALGYTAQKRMASSKAAEELRKAGQVSDNFRSIGRALKSNGTRTDHLILTCLQAGWTARNDQAGRFARGTKLFSDARWVANQTRGTNQYRHCSHVAYFWSQNVNPNVARFLGCDDKQHADAYSVAEMIQFIWRSRIRDGQPITVYMPCEKMRRLWARWLAQG